MPIKWMHLLTSFQKTPSFAFIFSKKEQANEPKLSYIKKNKNIKDIYQL